MYHMPAGQVYLAKKVGAARGRRILDFVGDELFRALFAGMVKRKTWRLESAPLVDVAMA